jgi:hypothetical protein
MRRNQFQKASDDVRGFFASDAPLTALPILDNTSVKCYIFPENR